MQDLFQKIAQVSQGHHPVLIVGETGTGKELVARAIHQNGPLRHERFIPVNCAALVSSLVGSELFGHIRGAFTGAVTTREGLLEAARGGTVLLDEISEMPVELQSTLLRVLQEKEVRPVGSTRWIKIGARLIAATNRNLEAAIRQGNFRPDLYFRLSVLTLKVPPLRDHKEDIPFLVNHFLERSFPEQQSRPVFSKEALDRMMDYDWPGNVRELENCIAFVETFVSAPVIYPSDLPADLQNPNRSSSVLNSCFDCVIRLSELKRQAIQNAISDAHGDKLLAARMLGIGKTTLYRKFKEYSKDNSQ